jgi:hypothetical protein
MRRVPVYLFALSILGAGVARAQTTTTYYVLIPTITPGVTETKVEMGRTNLSLSNVDASYVAEGTSGLDATPTALQVYVGPSTSKPNPLLNLNAVANSGGMVILNPVPGLNAVEVSFEVDEAPIKTAWKLPLLQAGDFYAPGSTAYVLNLVKETDAASNLQIFNSGNTEATCSVKVLRPKGTVLDERDGVKVPAVGVIRLADILSKVQMIPSAGINAAVSCDSPFYALGAYPATNRTRTVVEYPVEALPGATTAVVLEDRPGLFLNATQSNANLLIPLTLDPAVHYHTMTINFDAAVAEPPTFLVFWNIAGLFRHGGRRFGKTLFFGNFYNYDKAKYVADVGSPYIETTIKYIFQLLPLHRYHWSITLDNDQQSTHYVITDSAGNALMDTLVGLYNPIASDAAGDMPTLQVGLNGIADHAYFPPVGWRFTNLNVTVTK